MVTFVVVAVILALVVVGLNRLAKLRVGNSPELTAAASDSTTTFGTLALVEEKILAAKGKQIAAKAAHILKEAEVTALEDAEAELHSLFTDLHKRVGAVHVNFG